MRYAVLFWVAPFVAMLAWIVTESWLSTIMPVGVARVVMVAGVAAGAGWWWRRDRTRARPVPPRRRVKHVPPPVPPRRPVKHG